MQGIPRAVTVWQYRRCVKEVYSQYTQVCGQAAEIIYYPLGVIGKCPEMECHFTPKPPGKKGLNAARK